MSQQTTASDSTHDDDSGTSELSAALRAAARVRADDDGSRRSFIAALDRLLASLARAAWGLRALADEAAAGARRMRTGAGRRRRMMRVGWMLTAVIADYRLYAIYSAFLGRRAQERRLERIHRRSAARFLATSLVERGGFLKIGQMLSARPDLLPAAWIETLTCLQDDVPAEPFPVIRAIVERELGAPLEELFRSFDEAPAAAASIGQVHRAVALDGTELAVKVQRPGIDELIERDLELLELALDALAGVLPPMDRATVAAELRTQLRRELDYTREAQAMARLGEIVAELPGVTVPRPLPALSTPRVLTATWIDGEKITVALDRLPHEEGSSLLGRLLEVYLVQMLVAGAFQADPHPGNFLCSTRGELVLLDFGCVRELDEPTRATYVELVQRALTGDPRGLGELFPRLGLATRSGGTRTLELLADAFLAEFRGAAARGEFVWPTRAAVLSRAADLLEATQRDPVIRIPGELVMMSRVLGTLAGLFQHYRPRIDFAARVLPHLVRAAATRPSAPDRG